MRMGGHNHFSASKSLTYALGGSKSGTHPVSRSQRRQWPWLGLGGRGLWPPHLCAVRWLLLEEKHNPGPLHDELT